MLSHVDGKSPDKKLPTITMDSSKKMHCLSMFGKALVQQGRLQGEDNNYGFALLRVGEAQNDIGAAQLDYVTKMRQGLLFEVAEILGTVKEFEHLKKKLDNRRLDYDARQNKLSKSKKEKPALEEEVRACQFKYEETHNDMLGLMMRFGEREESLLGSLVEYAEIQAEYFRLAHERAAELVRKLKDQYWPGIRLVCSSV